VVESDHRDLAPGLVDAVQHSIGPSASGDDAVNLSTQSGSVSGVGEIAFCDGVAIVDAARY